MSNKNESATLPKSEIISELNKALTTIITDSAKFHKKKKTTRFLDKVIQYIDLKINTEQNNDMST